jgi:hypothetical protein
MVLHHWRSSPLLLELQAWLVAAGAAVGGGRPGWLRWHAASFLCKKKQNNKRTVPGCTLRQSDLRGAPGTGKGVD